MTDASSLPYSSWLDYCSIGYLVSAKTAKGDMARVLDKLRPDAATGGAARFTEVVWWLAPRVPGVSGLSFICETFHAITNSFVDDPTRGRARIRVCGASGAFFDEIVESGTFASAPLADLLCETGHRFYE